MSRPELILVYEPEEACRSRLASLGFDSAHSIEISSYLAQSTHLAREFEHLGKACERRELLFRAMPLDEAMLLLPGVDARRCVVWLLTDGITYFRGSIAASLSFACGLRTIGSEHALFALCQDKFRSGAVLRALGLPVPESGLMRGGTWLTAPPRSASGFFVKPNRLGAKIGIWSDSHCSSLGEAADISKRIFEAYRDDAVVQPYAAGRNVRASFLSVTPDAGPEALGVYFVDSGSDFQTMAESMELYRLGDDAPQKDAEPRLSPVADTHPQADKAIRDIAAVLMKGLGLRDVYSLDLRVEEDGTVHLIEFEVCPGLPGFDFRAYCAAYWNSSLAEAMAETVKRRCNV
jgi:D-alanine-D-alanine ligase-like ATP-grasp enzyme